MTCIEEMLHQIDELEADINTNRTELIEKLEQTVELLNKTVAKELSKILKIKCKFKVDYDPETYTPELTLYVPTDIDIKDIDTLPKLRNEIYEQISKYLARHHKELKNHIDIDIDEIIHVKNI